MSVKPIAAGKSSYDLIDVQKTFGMIGVKPDSTFLDLACGAGKYSIHIAQDMGQKGVVYAVDLWEEGIRRLCEEADRLGMRNIQTIVADIRKQLPLEETSMDACLLATILHDLSKSDQYTAIEEVHRLLKPGGTLNIIEFKRIEEGPGPPLDIRMGEDETNALVMRHPFEKVAGGDAGKFHYLIQYQKID